MTAEITVEMNPKATAKSRSNAAWKKNAWTLRCRLSKREALLLYECSGNDAVRWYWALQSDLRLYSPAANPWGGWQQNWFTKLMKTKAGREAAKNIIATAELMGLRETHKIAVPG
jgi:hypothetical protein